MSRVKRFIDLDVLQAARERIAHVMDTHDSWAVCFSGGKDSLVTLHLTRQVMEERGERFPVPVIFRDEEVIPPSVVEFVERHRHLEWLDLRWYCVPMLSHKFILGETTGYVQWDPEREHVRPLPEWGIQAEPGRVFDQYTMDEYTAEGLRGKVAYLTGIRAAESLIRYRASVNKLGAESYVNKSSSRRVSLCKPIYDWQENDVFKFLGENGIAYCEHYDMQLFAGAPFRVATPIHAENAKVLWRLREVDPRYYDMVLKVFPEMEVQDRYWRQIDRTVDSGEWGASYESVAEYVRTQITDPGEARQARRMLRNVMVRARKEPGSYPPDYLFTYFHNGSFKRELMPLKGGRAGD